jgi:hypothetical protein
MRWRLDSVGSRPKSRYEEKLSTGLRGYCGLTGWAGTLSSPPWIHLSNRREFCRNYLFLATELRVLGKR